ncbi:hypothetical protein B0T26DRAFT_681068 [Lasiosphaeria miniovina]|uniref:Uncharacterized protein n=1 Tax=Lasiosphaeria miniovina TaxID=1954250 RepID=A0AA40DJT7_9PEZI|nr:uncharacterized protein B0T26DRAFT_681068 [Lasiosphaeria miniovina]KAK0703387.1 hypothetical protein B0T26DRAFT_681068 [Lasiosphaeria miniovina]
MTTSSSVHDSDQCCGSTTCWPYSRRDGIGSITRNDINSLKLHVFPSILPKDARQDAVTSMMEELGEQNIYNIVEHVWRTIGTGQICSWNELEQVWKKVNLNRNPALRKKGGFSGFQKRYRVGQPCTFCWRTYWNALSRNREAQKTSALIAEYEWKDA